MGVSKYPEATICPRSLMALTSVSTPGKSGPSRVVRSLLPCVLSHRNARFDSLTLTTCSRLLILILGLVIESGPRSVLKVTEPDEFMAKRKPRGSNGGMQQ